MVFSSSVFLFAFMPLFFAVYFLLPWRKARNVWLLAASLFFYAWGEPVYVLLMVASILANWLFGLAIGRVRGRLASGAGEGERPKTPPRCGFCWSSRSPSTAWSSGSSSTRGSLRLT